MCRLWKLHLFFRSRELMVHVDIRTVAFGKYIVLVLGFAHWVGCVYFALARWSDFNNSAYASTWLEQFFNQTMFNYSCNPGQGDVGGVYAIAIYKGLNALANLGYDPTIPERCAARPPIVPKVQAAFCCTHTSACCPAVSPGSIYPSLLQGLG